VCACSAYVVCAVLKPREQTDSLSFDRQDKGVEYMAVCLAFTASKVFARQNMARIQGVLFIPCVCGV
jgi:hypothetical protein